MAKINIPCLVSRTAKNGVTSWYWQPSKTLREAGWQPVALGKNETEAINQARARNEEVARWKLGSDRSEGISRRTHSGTFGALVARYRREHLHAAKPGRKPLSPKTIETYEISLRRLEDWAGKHPVAFITATRVRNLRNITARPILDGGLGHSAAFNLLKTLRQVMAFAEAVEIIGKGTNPATNFDLGAPTARSAVWEADDEAAFIAAAYALNLPSMALAVELAIYTAQREGDLITFTENQLERLEIFDPTLRQRLANQNGDVMGWSFIQGKTSHPMEIPLEPTLLAKVDAAIRANRARDRAAEPQRLITYVLVNDRSGKPWRKRHFIKTWGKILDHAADVTGREHMRNLVWHDLRRTRVVRLRRRRMPKEMIATITGHSLRAIEAMLAVYGPVDPTMTASAIAASLDPLPSPDQEEEKRA